MAANAATVVDANEYFSPAHVNPNQVSTLIIELKNEGIVALTNLAFTKVLPSGLFVVKNSLINNCGGTIAAFNDVVSGNLVIIGAGISAKEGSNSGRCSIRLGVIAREEGVFVDMTALADIQAMNEGVLVSNQLDTKSVLMIVAKLSHKPLNSQ